MTKISAKMITHSKSEFGPEIGTMIVTFPRYILAELNTHRMFSKNSASSRAIPFKKLLKSVKENPFIPIAWQKDHSGMQGTEYLSNTEKYKLGDFIQALRNIFDQDEEVVEMFKEVLEQHRHQEQTLEGWWLYARDKAIECALILSCLGVTKQLVNRLLEPFMWHTVLITATEWENFFALRCPQYSDGVHIYRSKKDIMFHAGGGDPSSVSDTFWQERNKGMADIHMMALAESMWDCINESTPKELKAGEWHIPFGDNITWEDSETGEKGKFNIDDTIKIATARCARVSYTVVGEEGKEPNYNNDIKLYDKLASSGHWSPFEHCAQVMEDNDDFGNGKWSGNFRGFIQYRKTLPNENRG